MPFGELISIYRENNSERINMACDKRNLLTLRQMPHRVTTGL
jgi:hypothetical protein